MRRSLLFASLCLLFIAACAGLISSGGPRVTAATENHHYLILANGQGSGSTSFTSYVAAAGGTLTNNLEGIGVVTADSSDPNFAANMALQPGVQSVTEDREVQWISPSELTVDSGSSIGDSDPGATALPVANNETFSAAQWNLHQIHSDQTAANGDRGNGVTRARVAIVDTGIVASHIDIAANLNLALSTSFVPTEPSFVYPSDGTFSHCTHVAGIVAAPINGIGTQGVAPGAELVAVKVLRNSGSGSFASVIAGIEYASGPTVHADVINMSLGAVF